MKQNKRILVTGSTGGIGKPLCTHLASKGYDLLLTARNTPRLVSLATDLRQKFGDIKIDTVASDFERSDMLSELITAAMTGIDGLVMMPPQPAETSQCLPESVVWENLFKTSFINPVGLIRDLIPALKKAPRSKVVILSGISSAQVLSHYATSNVLRLAWLAQAKTMAHFYGPDKIHFNTLSLGGVLTDEYMAELQNEAKLRGTWVDAILAGEVSNVPLRKYATTHEVATAIEGLLSPFSDHITGMNILCDGGFTRAY